jgi:hypothetical protein
MEPRSSSDLVRSRGHDVGRTQSAALRRCRGSLAQTETRAHSRRRCQASSSCLGSRPVGPETGRNSRKIAVDLLAVTVLLPIRQLRVWRIHLYGPLANQMRWDCQRPVRTRCALCMQIPLPVGPALMLQSRQLLNQLRALQRGRKEVAGHRQISPLSTRFQ